MVVSENGFHEPQEQEYSELPLSFSKQFILVVDKTCMKNICVVTATRSEYGLLRWIIDILSKDKDVNLQIVATGSHLSKEFGMTYHFIEHDGYTIDAKIDMELHTEDLYSIPRSMGICA